MLRPLGIGSEHLWRGVSATAAVVRGLVEGALLCPTRADEQAGRNDSMNSQRGATQTHRSNAIAAWGLAVGVFLAIAALWSVGRVETSVADNARDGLADAGIDTDHLNVSASGREVTIAGARPGDDIDKIKRAADQVGVASVQVEAALKSDSTAPTTTTAPPSMTSRTDGTQAGQADTSTTKPATTTTAAGQFTTAEAAVNAELSTYLADNSIGFASGSPTPTPESDPVLDRIAELLAQVPNVQVDIVAHTDSSGSASANQTISQARAEAVAAALAARGIPAGQLNAEGRGSSEPIADNATTAGRAANRRVVFSLVKV